MGLLDKFRNLISSDTSGTDLKEIFRYGKKGTKLGLLDVLKAREHSSFCFGTKDKKKYSVNVFYDSISKKYIYEILDTQYKVVCGTKGSLEISLAGILEKLDFVGKDKTTSILSIREVPNYSVDEITESQESLSSRFDDLQKKNLERETEEKSIKEKQEKFKEIEREKLMRGMTFFEYCSGVRPYPASFFSKVSKIRKDENLQKNPFIKTFFSFFDKQIFTDEFYRELLKDDNIDIRKVKLLLEESSDDEVKLFIGQYGLGNLFSNELVIFRSYLKNWK